MANLLQCSSCSRHVRAAESACPFCAAPLCVGGEKAVAGTKAASSEGGAPSRSKRYALRAALLAGAATLAGGCSSAKKDIKDPNDKGDGTVLVQDNDKNPSDETLEQEELRRRQLEEMERRNRDRGPDMPYGCVWPDDEVNV